MKKLLVAAVMLLWSAFVFAVVNVNTATQAELRVTERYWSGEGEGHHR